MKQRDSISDPQYHPKHGWGFWLIGVLGLILTISGVCLLKLMMTIPAHGIVLAKSEAGIMAPANGKLEKVMISVGQKVKPGDLLFQLEDDDLRLKILNSSKELSQLEGMNNEESLSRKERAKRRSDIGLLKEEISILKKNWEELNIRAPIPGEVVYVDALPVGSFLSQGVMLAKIASKEGGYRIRTMVGEKNFDLLRVGTPARMKSGVFNSILEGYIWGKVSKVSNDVPNAQPNSHGEAKYEVEIDVDRTPHPLVLGSTVDVEFLLGRQSLLSLFLKRPAPLRDGEKEASSAQEGNK